jgi:hypothetical protein
MLLHNVTSLVVTLYCLCHVLRAITFRSDNGSNFDRVITEGCAKGFSELEVMTFIKKRKLFSPLLKLYTIMQNAN